MSSPAPKGWRLEVRNGLGEGSVIGEEKSRYYQHLLAIEAEADRRRVPMVSLMMDILSEWCKAHDINPDDY